jgi:hypothetical protein
MTKRLLFASAVLLVLPALGQGVPGGPGGGPGPMGFGGDRGGFGMHTPVTNAPYTATFTSTSTEKLQDGTVLTRNSTRTVERDSLGRTREEITMPARSGDASPHTMIVIMDPIARTITQLRPDQKIAVVRAIPQPPQGATGGHRGPGGPPPSDGQATGPKGRHEDKNVVTADLGSKTIDGVVATGKRVTRTIPAGQMGNPAAIVSTHEEWFATDLKIELSRNDVDPFHGTHATAVSSLSKTEPDASLFTVPSGYTVQQAPQRAFGRRGPHQDGSAPPPPPGV